MDFTYVYSYLCPPCLLSFLWSGVAVKGFKTHWSHINCLTQMRVLIINAGLQTAALNHRHIYPTPSSVPSTVIWSQIVMKKKEKTSRRSAFSASDRLLFCVCLFPPFLSSQWLIFNLINIAWAHWPEQRRTGGKKTPHLSEHLSDPSC